STCRAKVKIIQDNGFDNKTYNATEEKDTIYLTTACIFNVSLSDMQIVWYTYDNTTLKLLDETRMGNSMGPFNSKEQSKDTNIWGINDRHSTGVSLGDGLMIYVIRSGKKRSTNTPTLENTNPLTKESMLRSRFRSRGEKAAKPRHTETQPVGESDGDLQYISGENKHHLRAWFIHSQSDEDIPLCVEVLRDDTEIESDVDLRYNSGKNKHHLPDSCIHSQSGKYFLLTI
ncbi:hypothetical protein MAR_020594, partial [Mya arenaria]